MSSSCIGLLASTGSDLNENLGGVVVLFGAALLAAWLMRVARAPTILGYLMVGIAIGPFGLKLIEREQVEFFAELGLALLLFGVGLELSPAPLLRMGRAILIAATVQMGVCAALLAGAIALVYPLNPTAGILVGVGAALSSTAIILKHLSDRGEIGTPIGSIITGVLLIQDVAVIVLLIFLPLMAGGGSADGAGNPWISAVISLGGLVAVTVAARFALPTIINWVFRYGGQELTTLFAIVTAVLGSWLAAQADWSWALGAFIAGLLLAQTDLRHQLHAEVQPFRDALNALFFIAIGMLVDLVVFRESAVTLTLLIIATLIVKMVVTTAAVIIAGWPLRLGIAAGLGLCTVSEFAYVLANEAAKRGLMSETLMAKIIVLTVGTMLIGALFAPIMTPAADWLSRRFKPDRRRDGDDDAPESDPHAPRDPTHVLIVGYGLNGRNLARVLTATRVPYSVLEMNRGTAQAARRDGVPEVFVGDGSRQSILHEAGIGRAHVLVVAISDRYATRRIVSQANAARPGLYILARTRYVEEIEKLHALGAQLVIPEEFETSIEIFAHVLQRIGMPRNVIEQQIQLVRLGQYAMLRGQPMERDASGVEWARLLETGVTQTYLLMQGSDCCGKTLGELNLRALTGVTVVAVTRGGKPVAAPGPDFRVAAGDVLVLVGSHAGLDRAKTILDPPSHAPEHPAPANDGAPDAAAPG